MNREILFRGKSINSNEWIESMTVAKGTIKHKRDCVYLGIENEGWETSWNGIYPQTIGQLLFIINGHHFFEGDIIGKDRSSAKYVILWNEENQCFSAFNCYDFKNLNGNDELLKLNTLCNMEQVRVSFLKKYNFYPIGNIHDNPEMIEAAN
jgi:hypothetical protein